MGGRVSEKSDDVSSRLSYSNEEQERAVEVSFHVLCLITSNSLQSMLPIVAHLADIVYCMYIVQRICM